MFLVHRLAIISMELMLKDGGVTVSVSVAIDVNAHMESR